MKDARKVWGEVVAQMQVVARLDQVRALLQWDQQTHLPPVATEGRTEQLALLSALHHQHLATPKLGEQLEWLASQGGALDEAQLAGIANLTQQWRRAAAVPEALVTHMGRLEGRGHAAWVTARAEGRFEPFAPVLSEWVAASIEKAQAIDADQPAFDVLLEEFEPGATAASLVPTFERLRAGLLPLLDAIRGRPPLPLLARTVAPDVQLSLFREVARRFGYTDDNGRLDLSVHPFSARVGDADVRITTRIEAGDLLGGLGSTLHEVGHALYEQGLPGHLLGTGLEGPASMGLHESQSRFWENTIGGSLPFFRWVAPLLGRFLGSDAPDADALYAATNRVVRGPIRVAADEVTYNLHVLVRFDIERALFDGSLAVADLPEAWNAAYRDNLGVEPRNLVEGVLQDVHWSGGAFGYFPTYTLGNLYAAAFGKQLAVDLPDLFEHVEKGNFSVLLDWLRQRIHVHGHRWHASALVARIAPGVDPVDALVEHLWDRHGAAHGAFR